MPEEAIQILSEIRNELNRPRVKFLTRKDIMKMLKYSEATVSAMFRRADFPAIAIGKSYVVEESAFIKWCRQRRV